MRDTLLYKWTSSSEDETEQAGRTFAGSLADKGYVNGYPFVALAGDLGAGKTVFARGMAAVLAPGAQVHSPSYTVVNEYRGPVPMFHMDFYRLETEEDLISVGYDEYPERGIIVAEWSEKIPEVLPPVFYRVAIAQEHDGTRTIRVWLSESGHDNIDD